MRLRLCRKKEPEGFFGSWVVKWTEGVAKNWTGWARSSELHLRFQNQNYQIVSWCKITVFLESSEPMRGELVVNEGKGEDVKSEIDMLED